MHKFSRSDISKARHIFEQNMLRSFGEIYTPKSDGEYRGVCWDCYSMLTLDAGIWHLTQRVLHKDSKRVFGKIEEKEAGHCLRFILFYEPVIPEGVIIRP